MCSILVKARRSRRAFNSDTLYSNGSTSKAQVQAAHKTATATRVKAATATAARENNYCKHLMIREGLPASFNISESLQPTHTWHLDAATAAPLLLFFLVNNLLLTNLALVAAWYWSHSMNEDGEILEVRRVSCLQPDLRIYCSKQAPHESLKRCPPSLLRKHLLLLVSPQLLLTATAALTSCGCSYCGECRSALSSSCCSPNYYCLLH